MGAAWRVGGKRSCHRTAFVWFYFKTQRGTDREKPWWCLLSRNWFHACRIHKEDRRLNRCLLGHVCEYTPNSMVDLGANRCWLVKDLPMWRISSGLSLGFKGQIIQLNLWKPGYVIHPQCLFLNKAIWNVSTLYWDLLIRWLNAREWQRCLSLVIGVIDRSCFLYLSQYLKLNAQIFYNSEKINLENETLYSADIHLHIKLITTRWFLKARGILFIYEVHGKRCRLIV